MKLGKEQNTVAQCFNLSLQASFLIPKVHSSGCSLVDCVWLDTPTLNLVLATARALCEYSLYSFWFTVVIVLCK